MANSVQPQEDERALIGRLMLGTRYTTQVLQILDTDALVDLRHRDIYELISSLYRHSEPIDVASVEAALHASGKLTQVGGSAMLHEMITSANACPNGAVLSVACGVAERQQPETLPSDTPGPLFTSSDLKAYSPRPTAPPQAANPHEANEDDCIASLIAVLNAARRKETTSHDHQVNAAVALAEGIKAMAQVAHPSEYGVWRESMFEVVKYMATSANEMANFLDAWASICEERWDMYARPERSKINPATADLPADLLDGRRKATPAEARSLAATDAIDIRAMADAYRRAYEVALHRLLPTGFDSPTAPLLIETALYLWYDADDLLLYLGITGDLAVRQTSHAKRSSWGEFATRSEVRRYPSRERALAAEVELIRELRPLFNSQHNDTPEARERLVAYLVEKGRLDLLTPAVSRG